MVQKTMAQSRPVAIASDQSAIPVQIAGGLGGPDIEVVVSTYVVKTAFTGASVGDTVTCTQILDTSTSPITSDTIWRNQSTATDFTIVPSATNLTLVGSNALTNAELRAAPVPVLKGQQSIFDCTIASGQSLSAGVDLGVTRLVGIEIPATFEPSTLTFQASVDNSTWNNIFTSGETSVTASPSRRIVVAPADFYGIRYIRVRGGTSASPTTAAADRILKLIAEA